MPHTFVLDASVLLHDPLSVIQFPRHEVVIPLGVIEELSSLKRYRDDMGKSARIALQFIDGLRKEGRGDFHTGLTLEGEIKIQIIAESSLSAEMPMAGPHNSAINVAYQLNKVKKEGVTLISKDFTQRIKAEALGITVEDYAHVKVPLSQICQPLRTCEVSQEKILHFFKDGAISVGGLEAACPFYANEYVILKSPENQPILAKFFKSSRQLTRLLPVEENTWGIAPLNLEQKCAFDLILSDEIKLVSLIGPAGTGKTLIALACGLKKVLDESVYDRILVSRPIVPLGKDIGYLPGSKEEKLQAWTQPIRDNLEFLCLSAGSRGKDTLTWIESSHKLEMEAVTYIRGRSLPKMFIIVDEAQNLTPHEIKTVISRAGKGTKVILTGDPSQIDHPYLDQDSNGLTYAAGHMYDQPICGHLFLSKTERSCLAALAIELM